MTDAERRGEPADSARSGASPRDAYRLFAERVPAMAAHAPKRNALVLLGALLGIALSVATVASVL